VGVACALRLAAVRHVIGSFLGRPMSLKALDAGQQQHITAAGTLTGDLEI
jgi:hypothetical protein